MNTTTNYVNYETLCSMETVLTPERINELCTIDPSFAKAQDKWDVIWLYQPSVHKDRDEYATPTLPEWQEARVSKFLKNLGFTRHSSRCKIHTKLLELRKSGMPTPQTFQPVAVIRDKESGFPQVIYVGNNDGYMYLSPFRGYCFQFSGTIDGVSDCGSTEVFGLNNVLDAIYGTNRRKGYQSNISRDKMGKEMLYNMAMVAMFQASYTGEGYGTRAIVNPSSIINYAMQHFIDAVVAWLHDNE